MYLDTTVISAYFDARTIERQRLTQQLWNERLHAFEPVISNIVLREIWDTPIVEKRAAMGHLVNPYHVLPFTNEAEALSQEYVRRGIFPEKYSTDADHVAIAVVHGVIFFSSWNYKHLVKIATRREINLLNALWGYGPIEIVTPPEL